MTKICARCNNKFIQTKRLKNFCRDCRNKITSETTKLAMHTAEVHDKISKNTVLGYKIRNCKYCKNEFKPIASIQRFCSDSCITKFYEVEKLCLYCSFKFVTNKKRPASFCTQRCRLKYIHKNRTPERKAEIDKKIGLAQVGRKNPIASEWCKIHQPSKSSRARKKNSIAHTGTNNSRYGTHCSAETKKKMRESKINQIIENGSWVSIGKNEAKLLDEQEIKDNCKIERQYKIKGLGRIPDGYCKETNTVYDVYESYHLNQIEHDLKRQQEIIDFLKCKFVIIWDLENNEKELVSIYEDNLK